MRQVGALVSPRRATTIIDNDPFGELGDDNENEGRDELPDRPAAEEVIVVDEDFLQDLRDMQAEDLRDEADRPTR